MDAVLSTLRERISIARETSTPLRLRGAGTKDFYGEYVNDASFAGQVLDLRDYRGIVDYEPSELLITARCGTPLSEIERTLAEREQCLGFEPPFFGGDPTLGGVIAAGLSGPRRMQAGAVRDFVLGTTLLNTDGELLRFGGRVMKNVAGFDVPRLLCGSMGILGVLTEISIKVLPKPRSEETLLLEMSESQALDAFNRWGGQSLPISGAAWHEERAWVRLSGATPAVLAACARIGGERVDATVADRWWQQLRDCTHPFFSNESIWRLSVPSTQKLTLPGKLLIDWGGALRWYAEEPMARDAPGVAAGLGEVARLGAPAGLGGTPGLRATADFGTAAGVGGTTGLRTAVPRRVAATCGGSALRWRGAAPEGRFHPLAPAVAVIHRRLKLAFDPLGLFNPGRLLADL